MTGGDSNKVAPADGAVIRAGRAGVALVDRGASADPDRSESGCAPEHGAAPAPAVTRPASRAHASSSSVALRSGPISVGQGLELIERFPSRLVSFKNGLQLVERGGSRAGGHKPRGSGSSAQARPTRTPVLGGALDGWMDGAAQHFVPHFVQDVIHGGAGTALAEGFVGDFSVVPTDAKVVFEPQLEGGRIDDVRVLKDKVRETPVLGFVVEQLFQPLSMAVFFPVAVLVPLWGYYAIADLLAAAKESVAAPGTATSWPLVVMALWGVSLTVMMSVLALDFHPAIVRLIWGEAKLKVVLVIGSRLLYTAAAISYFPHYANVTWLVGCLANVMCYCFDDALLMTHKMRFKPEPFQNLYGHGAIAARATYTSMVFGLSLECVRHFALLLAAKQQGGDGGEHCGGGAPDGGGSTTTIELVPPGFMGGRMRVTNVHIMNFTFTAAMLCVAQVFWSTFQSRGEHFAMVTTRINMHRVMGGSRVPSRASTAASAR